MAKKRVAKKRYKIFISHSSKDDWVSRQIDRLIRETCRKPGVDTFIDNRELKVGDRIADEIRKNLQECDEFLILITPNSIKSTWVTAEMGAAWGMGKRIVVIINNVTPNEMPDIISPLKAIDLNNFDQYLNELLARVEGNGT